MNKRTILQICLCVAGVFLCYAIQSSGLVKGSLILIFQYVGIYIILVLGINVVNGYLGIFSLAHAGIMAVGAYTASLFSMHVFSRPWMFPFSLLSGGAASVLIGLLVALPSFTVKGDYLAIITLGFSLIVKSILQNLEAVGGPRGLRPIPKYTNLAVVYICVIFAIVIARRLVHSKYGRSMLAVREDPVASELMSVNVKRIKLIAFSVSAFLIGISGALLSHLLSYTNPNSYGYSTIVDGLVMVYLGGIGSITGSVIGAAIWQVLVQTLRSIGTWRWVIGGLLLILIMVFLPEGIFGNREFSPQVFRGAVSGIKRRLGQKTGARSGADE
jgi:branched-chain amino acid transport system permease protein